MSNRYELTNKLVFRLAWPAVAALLAILIAVPALAQTPTETPAVTDQPPAAGPLTITAVQPGTLINDSEAEIIITGTGFVDADRGTALASGNTNPTDPQPHSQLGSTNTSASCRRSSAAPTKSRLSSSSSTARSAAVISRAVIASVCFVREVQNGSYELPLRQ